ncbi:SAP-like protein BP-73 [Iris pallida]|uniref:SAP-like protein BP-73 n=1 Tax=Iris pallida TaxID=29817 RepID=A0AAX6H650_IRIPA|nr:SAP-like protein BP-73 [Iris pallida]
MAMATPANSGCILPDGKWKASGRTALSSYSCSVGHKLFSGANIMLKTVPVYSPRDVSFTCKASPNNHRRNPDFSRQHKGSSRGKNRQHQERDNSESLEDSDPLPSKNGSLLSLSSNQSQRYSATATPGKREKEIVELFRKVQAQLRERAAIKEEKKIETLQQGQGERGTVDSLLKLLRKHSMTQGKKSAADEEFNTDQLERDGPFEDEPIANFFSSNSLTSSDEAPEPNPVPSIRPPSKFQRRSPVPRVKFQPVFSAEEVRGSNSALKSKGKKKDIADVGEREVEAFEEPGEVSSDELSDSSDTEIEKEYAKEESTVESADLSSLKLVELRGLAKSRGIKGYSKLKKGELVELLSGNSS